MLTSEETIVTSFNYHMRDLIHSVIDILPRSSLIDKRFIKAEAKKITDQDKFINTFILHMLEYKPYIDNCDDTFTTLRSFREKVDNNIDIANYVDYLSDKWHTLDINNKAKIFANLGILCKYAQIYFVMHFGS